jgi:hypothetical protein
MGENMKFEMVMAFVDFADADPAEELDPDPDPPLLQAARSSAAARTRTTAPPLNRTAGSRIIRPPVRSG